jgi:hypothetical protein
MSDFLMTLPEDVALRLTERVNQMMLPGGKYDPFTPDNVAEALVSLEDDSFIQLATVLRANDSIGAGAAVHLMVREYWFDYACRVEAHHVEEEADFNPCAIAPWERDLPAIIRPQVAW